jgi:Holliday junction resolvasome RuvABC endonuclease subunit
MRNHKARILAIDPGTGAIGVAYFEGNSLIDYGVKIIKRGKSLPELLVNLESIITRVVGEKDPQLIILEKNGFSQIRQNALMTLALARIRAVARGLKIPVLEYASNSVRKAVCGNGHAAKYDLLKVLISRYPELKAFIGPTRRWKEKYFLYIFGAIALGLAFINKRSNHDGN